MVSVLPYPKALRTHIARLLGHVGPKDLCRVFGPFFALGICFPRSPDIQTTYPAWGSL